MADAKKIVRIDYKAYFADADRLYDTTNADAAKEAGIFNEKVTYAPMAYIVGSGSLYADLDAAIAGAEVGKEVEVTIPCEKAAGARNPRLIELHPIKEFYKNEINPYPGMSVSLGNRNGVVMSVGAGRVKVDFNNPLAGHDLKYEVTVVEEVTDPVEKAKCIMEMDFGTSEGFGFGIMEDKVVSSSPRPRSASSTRAGPSPSTGSSRTTATPSESTASSSSRSGSPRRPTPPPPSDCDPTACKPFTKNTLFLLFMLRGGVSPSSILSAVSAEQRDHPVQTVRTVDEREPVPCVIRDQVVAAIDPDRATPHRGERLVDRVERVVEQFRTGSGLRIIRTGQLSDQVHLGYAGLIVDVEFLPEAVGYRYAVRNPHALHTDREIADYSEVLGDCHIGSGHRLLLHHDGLVMEV